MKRVEATIRFTVPSFYTFDDTARLVSKLMEPVRKVVKEGMRGSVLANDDADVASVVVDEDDEG